MSFIETNLFSTLSSDPSSSDPNPSGTLYSLYFSTERDESFWLVFTSLTLGILTAFQATIFCFIVYRLVFILARRNSEQYDAASHEVRGIVWVSAGVKIGALESLLGFAGGSFGIALARRIMRFSSRVCLCIGLSMRYVFFVIKSGLL